MTQHTKPRKIKKQAPNTTSDQLVPSAPVAANCPADGVVDFVENGAGVEAVEVGEGEEDGDGLTVGVVDGAGVEEVGEGVGDGVEDVGEGPGEDVGEG